MSWLRPENISHSDYNPQKLVEAFVKENGETGRIVLDTFNTVDPLNIFYNEETNPDEYIGYAKRILKEVGQRPLVELTREEITAIVRNSFHPDQIGVFVSEDKIETLINYLDSLKGI